MEPRTQFDSAMPRLRLFAIWGSHLEYEVLGAGKAHMPYPANGTRQKTNPKLRSTAIARQIGQAGRAKGHLSAVKDAADGYRRQARLFEPCHWSNEVCIPAQKKADSINWSPRLPIGRRFAGMGALPQRVCVQHSWLNANLPSQLFDKPVKA